MRDPYTVLGVPRGASDDEIKSAYRKLAKKLHPDVNPGKRAVEQQFKEVTAAYDFLSDPQKRQRYDRGEIGPDGAERMQGFRYGNGAGSGFARGKAGQRAGTSSGFGGGIDDIISEFLNRGSRRETQNAASEMPAQRLAVSFLEAARGGKRRVTVNGRAYDVAIPAGIEAGQRLRLKSAEG